ncbi:hypothetical protein [Alienimonas californiensis]|uniref:Uncharacterized protein n=1 Tax=Alienimonas californiensis TaxID=2527989 RepID=A0A517PDK3_9PLAN|nr:hypothetical protein [Alienimonas californiensis]QDT17411.1 hypothetical protein CA12_35330 [Alienimonas californiensis]
MAAQGKSTGLQVGLIIAVVVALIASVAAFIIYRQDSQNQVRYATIEQEKENVQRVNETLRNEIAAIKQTLGTTASEAGLADRAAGTVLGDLDARIANYNTDQNEQTLFQVVENLDALLEAERSRSGQYALTNAAQRQEINGLNSKYSRESQQYMEARNVAVADRGDVQAATDERIRAEQARRQEIEDTLASTKAELEEVKEQLANREAELEDQIAELAETNRRLNRDLAMQETRSFTTADGKIVNLQRSTDTVYLNLGSRQNLRPGVTFSVYDKEQVGPTGGDISALKGSIEVLSVGEQISEARITEVTTLEPLSVGDPIFSPAWSPGRKSLFAFVGMIDLDGDGNTTGERDRLRRILNDAGAEISVYVDDDGNWVDGDGDPNVNKPLDVNTEMLVLGNIPDPSEVSDPARKAAFSKMREHLTEIRGQAERNGIVVKNLKTFLDTMGVQSTRRRFVPGQDPNFNNRGDRDRQVDPNPSSPVSGLFDPNRGRRGSEIDPQPSSRFNPQR